MIFSIFITVLVNFIGLTIVLPVFGPLILDGTYGFFPNITDPAMRVRILSWLLACYPIGQFLGSPILGALSDVHGRKKILLIGILGSCLGFVLAGAAVFYKSLSFLILGRIFAGLSAGTIAICYSAIADIAIGANRAGYFTAVTLAIGLGWILGPIIGGSFPVTNSIEITHSLPFFAGAFLSLINCFWVAFAFPETLKVFTQNKITLLVGIRNILSAVKMEQLNKLFLVWFLFMFGWASFMQFFSPLMIQMFGYTKNELGTAYTIYGSFYALSQLLITRLLAKRFSEEQILKIFLIGLGFVISLIMLAPTERIVLILFACLAIICAIIIPNGISLVSRLARQRGQGEVLGINQSIQSLAWMMPPMLIGMSSSFRLSYIMGISSTAVGLAWLVFVRAFRHKTIID